MVSGCEMVNLQATSCQMSQVLLVLWRALRIRGGDSSVAIEAHDLNAEDEAFVGEADATSFSCYSKPLSSRGWRLHCLDLSRISRFRFDCTFPER